MIITTANEYSALDGFVQRLVAHLEQSRDFAFDQDLISWRVIMRTDSDYLDTTGAIKHLIQL